MSTTTTTSTAATTETTIIADNSNSSPQTVLEPRAVSRDLFSATIGSIVCCYVGQPFDTIKVKQQTNPDYYTTSILRTTSRIWTEEGIAAFWKGAVPTAGGMVLENCMAFGVNEALKRAFSLSETSSDHSTMPSMWQPFAMGAITGCCSATVLLPSEIVKAKTQITTQRNVTSQDIVRKMLQQQGLKSFFVGLDAQLCRDATFYALFFGGYELSCYAFRTMFPTMPDELNYFLSGGIAGMGGWFFAMPFDVPKTNVQARYDTHVIGSYFPELLKIGRQRGISGLYAGLGPTLVRAFPANAALFLGVESGKKVFDNFVWKE